MFKILVAYATKHNSTAEIAHVIGDVLRAPENHHVEVQPVETVEDITAYQVVVLGSAVYAGQWQSSAVNFLRKHEQELAQRDVWLFSSGPTGEGDAKTLLKGWEFPEKLKPVIARIKPRDIALFHGKMDADDLNLFERTVIKMVKAPTGDFRDWEQIQKWADRIGQEISERELE